ncbi:hypothetical protein J6590_082319 [Homalodisca vitripennis]|nr:hypothetical protein J6590_082319 [Homalodisca vitripennis]
MSTLTVPAYGAAPATARLRKHEVNLYCGCILNNLESLTVPAYGAAPATARNMKNLYCGCILITETLTVPAYARLLRLYTDNLEYLTVPAYGACHARLRKHEVNLYCGCILSNLVPLLFLLGGPATARLRKHEVNLYCGCILNNLELRKHEVNLYCGCILNNLELRKHEVNLYCGCILNNLEYPYCSCLRRGACHRKVKKTLTSHLHQRQTSTPTTVQQKIKLNAKFLLNSLWTTDPTCRSYTKDAHHHMPKFHSVEDAHQVAKLQFAAAALLLIQSEVPLKILTSSFEDTHQVPKSQFAATALLHYYSVLQSLVYGPCATQYSRVSCKALVLLSAPESRVGLLCYSVLQSLECGPCATQARRAVHNVQVSLDLRVFTTRSYFHSTQSNLTHIRVF